MTDSFHLSERGLGRLWSPGPHAPGKRQADRSRAAYLLATGLDGEPSRRVPTIGSGSVCNHLRRYREGRADESMLNPPGGSEARLGEKPLVKL